MNALYNSSTIEIGFECAEARKLHGINIRQMAQITGYDKSKLSRFENGKFDDDIFLMYYPFWTRLNECICMDLDPRQEIEPLEDVDDFLARSAVYCIYNGAKEARYMQLTDHSCSTDYWKTKELVEKVQKLCENNEFTR